MDAKKVQVLDEEWAAALVDGGLEAQQVRLYPFPGVESGNGNRAYYFTPGQRIYADADFPDELGAQLQDANKRADRHRITIWVDVSQPILGARMRHELEHVRQVEAHGDRIMDLNDLVLAVLSMKLEGLLGGGQLYNAMPMEVDANAAAARFAFERYGDETARALADPENEAGFSDSVIFRSVTPSAPVETLPKRTLAFLFQFADLCELLAQRKQKPFPALPEEVWPGMAAAWEALGAVEVVKP